jgi:hypothetical protein
MKANKPITSFISTLLILALAQSAMAVKVSKQEEAQWLHCVIPLPKQISIMSKVELPAAAVKIRLRQDAGEVVKTAAASPGPHARPAAPSAVRKSDPWPRGRRA